MRNKRFKLLKVCGWVGVINIFFLALTLVMLFYVKLPNQHYNLKAFNVGRFWLRGFISIVFQTFFYFFSLNTYYKMAVAKKSWKSYTGFTLLILACVILYSVLYDFTIKKEEFLVAFDISAKIFSYSISTFFMLGVAVLIVAITKQLDEKKKQLADQKILEQRTAILEKEKMQADYLFLKAQINPHFLHNTLNFLYARSLPLSNELSEGILTLSEIMRYSLDKAEDADGKVLLTREIEHVHNIIKLQQLRFGNALQLQFTISGQLEGLKILPFVLITIAENAFKHGELKDPSQPVQLDLSVDAAGKLRFSCINKKKTGPKELSTGIGLDNTRKRLGLAYGENYSLYIRDQRELFTVELSIIL